MNKKQIQEAIARIDNALAQLNINRQGHIVLTNDMKLVQGVCMNYFEGLESKKEAKNVGTNKSTVRPKSRGKDS